MTNHSIAPDAPMSAADTLDTLASIERVLTADRCSVSVALDAAYKLGRIDGMLEIFRAPQRDLDADDQKAIANKLWQLYE